MPADGRIVKNVKPGGHERHIRVHDALLDKKLNAEATADDAEAATTANPAGSCMLALPCFRTGGTTAYHPLLGGLPPVTAKGFGSRHRVGARSFDLPATISVVEPMRHAAAQRESESALC